MTELKLAFKTFGCRANSVDTDIMRAEARRRGFTIVPDSGPADAYIINSCTVTHGADRDTRYQARRYRRLNARAIVGVVGCYAQVAPQELEANDSVDFVVGSANKTEILNLIQATFRRKSVKQLGMRNPTGFLVENFPGSENTRAAIKIQDGCNFSCTFCIIPQARGRSHSLPPATVKRQVEQAYAQGFQEVVLTGIHIAHYGWDQKTCLLELVKILLETADGPRIRLSTLDPFEIPDELITLTHSPLQSRLCPYFHIALQSGSDSVLRRMKRIYRAEEFFEVTEKIRKANPDNFVTVDVIAGFPGETEAEFEATVELLERSHWSRLHAFPYSQRRNTPAAEMETQVPPDRIKARMRRLLDLSNQRYQEFIRNQVGAKRAVLVERKKNELWLGHTENYIPVVLSGHVRQGQITPAVISKVTGDEVYAVTQG